jgi:hypothetical protein
MGKLHDRLGDRLWHRLGKRLGNRFWERPRGDMFWVTLRNRIEGMLYDPVQGRVRDKITNNNT